MAKRINPPRSRDWKEIRLVVDPDGTSWWESWTGDRLPYNEPYLRITDTATGKVVYSSGKKPGHDVATPEA